MGRILGGLAVGLIAAAPLLSQAQNLTYRCSGSDGKKYYGSTIPMRCAGRLVEVLNSSGMVVKRIDQVAEEKARAAKAAAASASRGPEQSIAERDEERRNRALLATYTSVKDIEDARTRALRENAQQAGRFEQKINELKTRRGRYEKELATYKKDGKVSTTVEDNIKNVDLEIRVQDELLVSKRKEVDGINAKYDQDKRRYSEALAAKNK
jgi:hypothetical protein